MSETKTCSKCNLPKTLDLFFKNNVCKECKKARDAAHYQQNKERRLQQAKTWEDNNREKVRENKKRWYCQNRERCRQKQQEWRIKTNENLNRRLRDYGLTLEQYEALYQKYDGQCHICKQIMEGAAHIDHNHDTDKVRGLLCNNCNTAIGLLKENVIYLTNAINYLNEHNNSLPITS